MRLRRIYWKGRAHYPDMALCRDWLSLQGLAYIEIVAPRHRHCPLAWAITEANP